MRLLWKEWQQQKWIIFWGLLAGISSPLLEYFYVRKDNGYFQTDTGSAALLAAGALFAIILAIATMYHDIRKGVDIFWQSKPVKPWKLFTVKILLAAILLYIVFLAVIGIDLITYSRDSSKMSSFAWAAFCYTYPIALLLFALSMFLMVITRDAAKAAFLTMWAGLLIYFLPLMFRGLEWMNIFEQLNNNSNRPSVVQYLIWLCSVPGKIDSGTAVYRPAGIPVSVYKMSVFQGLLNVVGSPLYLRYLVFVAVSAIASIVCIVLSLKAVKHNWRWQPGQKSIVWAIGISAAAIFGVAMVQVGHNLEPVKALNGKQLVNPVYYDWNYMPASLSNGLPEGDWIHGGYFGSGLDAMCFKDDLMFKVTCGWQGRDDQRPPKYDDEVIHHIILQIYRFPSAENNKADSGLDKAPNFVIGALDIFAAGPVRTYENPNVFGCFVRGDYLYTAYRPQLRTNKDKRMDLKNTPIYFSTIDISNPAAPILVGSFEINPTMNFCLGFADYGDYCYLSDGGQLVIISVANTGKPEIVRQISYVVGGGKCGTVKTEKEDYVFELGGDPGFPSHHFSIVGDKMLCSDYRRISLLDLKEPQNPTVIYDELFLPRNHSEYVRIPKPALNANIQNATFKDNKIYISTKDGIFVRELIQQDNGNLRSKLLGWRKTTPIEKLAGRSPGELLLSGNYLIEQAGGFGMLVYDVSDPTKPRRVYHAQVGSFASDIGFWNGLLFMQEYGFKTSFYKLP